MRCDDSARGRLRTISVGGSQGEDKQKGNQPGAEGETNAPWGRRGVRAGEEGTARSTAQRGESVPS